MITKIGIVAGEIWNYLDNHEREAFAGDVIANLDKERDIVLMSIGWLAREGHILVKGNPPDYSIHLT